MRDLQFRAYIKDIKKIVDVYDIDFLQETISFMNPYDTKYTCKKFNDIEFMQYTGLTDKNGTKIFEGDIVKATYDGECEKTYQVMFFNGGYKMKSKNCNTVYDYSIHDEHPDFEVIGNIYDNPELLEGV